MYSKFSKSKTIIFNQLSKEKDRRIDGSNTIPNSILPKSKCRRSLIQNRLKIIYFQNSRKAELQYLTSLSLKKRIAELMETTLFETLFFQNRNHSRALIEPTKIDHLLFLYISIFTLAYCSFLIAREGSVNRARQPSRTVLMKANKVARG